MALLDFSTAPYGGEARLLPESSMQPRIRPTQLIFHSIVGSAAGALNFFGSRSGLESTFIVAKSGRIWQLMDTERQADANFRANVRAGSVETEDNGDPDTDPWTAQQLAALQWIAAQYHNLHGVPLRQCPAWDAPGIGYHRLFVRQWSTVPGKTCPGDVRVRQFHQVLLPAIIAGEEPDVPYGHWPEDHQHALVRDVARQVKWDVLGLQRLMLQFLAAGQYNSVFPGLPRPDWAQVAVSTNELADLLRQVLEEMRSEEFPVAAPAPPGGFPTAGTAPGTPGTAEADGRADADGQPPPAPDAGPEMEVGGDDDQERLAVALALQARIDTPDPADPSSGEAAGDRRSVEVALLARAVALLGDGTS